ncbi:hypothetical protein JOC36_000802 [Weissella uvarum]|uniref:HK97 gp10 family phage protein n=1 Tax=Weissella uvarum TaxID=1479233 RepID=UPI00196046A7|nr:HK97 gp10 family phage protein [Weissella uvarum]MBM7617253.1 hypothetical protein [Weissella uvarum]MCM0595158.1 HK97 gp10 family phage protein [Weissella uvarum]
MSDFSNDLDQYAKQLLSLVDLSVSDKEKITKAGATVFKKNLQATIRSRHYRVRSTGENPHLADTLSIRAGNRDGRRVGAYTVGWGNSKQKDGKDYIANFIENGTRTPFVKTSSLGKKYRLKRGGQVAVRKDPFISETQQDDGTNARMIKAMGQAYNKITKE